jgi:two-component system C4-dicarboxylate transport sensor histidine kinase DctB
VPAGIDVRKSAQMIEARRPGRRLWLAALLLLVGGAVLTGIGGRWAEARARAAADATARQTALGHVGLLVSELQKFRLLPLVLGQYPDVATALTGDGRAARRLDETLETLAARTDAAAIYVIDASGRTVAASNARLPTSFVGQNYAFRPYFRDAMRGGVAELFALGTVSGRPGLYLGRRVDRQGRRLGVVVVKVEFDSVEAGWARSPGATIVTDRHGVILVTSVPGWRFGATGALDPATLADARRTLQFGAAPPRRAPVNLRAADANATLAGDTGAYRVASEPAPLAAARLIHLTPLDPPLAAARLEALLWGLALLLVLGTTAALLLRSAERRRLQQQAREALEEEVAHRTIELREANAQLVVESNERADADRRFRAAREELAQANRLGTLGQITAGVAHEINQPVAAIRTFAENGVVLLDRQASDPARMNLQRIVELTERIGTITRELRAFARRRTPAGGTTMLGAVIDGTLLLIGERARGIVRVEAGEPLRSTTLVGDRIRLEQILINLVQNALDAVAGRADAEVLVAAARHGDTVSLRVADDGAGLDPAIVDTLFTPFASAKANGLGLGLAIARDIAREFGGDIVHQPGGRGATFIVTFVAA